MNSARLLVMMSVKDAGVVPGTSKVVTSFFKEFVSVSLINKLSLYVYSICLVYFLMKSRDYHN